MDSFAPYKNTGTKKVPPPIDSAQWFKFCEEEKMREDLKAELSAQNVLASIIPGGGTEQHWDDHQEEWKAGKFTKTERRVLMTYWVGRAWDILHLGHRDLIIKTFRQTGLALNPDGSEDLELKIRDLPGLEVGDWTREDMVIIPDEVTTEVSSLILSSPLLTSEARDGIEGASESEADITTDTGSDTDDIVDSDDEEDFDLVGDDDDLINMDMD
ncbi:hypothetical protein V8E51_010960 [Hyaloscypha variabilis]